MGNASDEGAVHLPTVFDSRWRKAWPNGEKVGKGRIEVTQCCAFCEFAWNKNPAFGVICIHSGGQFFHA
jgi:hypothetical protein